MKKYSFGQSFLTAHDLLVPNLSLGGISLVKGDMSDELKGIAGDPELVLDHLDLDVPGILGLCRLDAVSELSLRIDLDCRGFSLCTNIWSSVLADVGGTTWESVHIATIPRAVVAEGFTLRISVVATRPVPDHPTACSTRGGTICSWETRIPSRNKAIMFPLQEGDVSSVWRLDVAVESPDDLDLPARAALRLTLDSGFLRHLVGESTAPDVRRSAVSWLMVEAGTAAVLHVLSNDELRDHFAVWLSTNPPIEKTLDPRSVGFYLVTILRRARVGDLAAMHSRIQLQPDQAAAEIRANLASPLRSGAGADRQGMSA